MIEMKVDKKKLDRLIPKLAKDKAKILQIQNKVSTIKTNHQILIGDSRDLSFIPEETIHLIITSPPYWNLKKYENDEGQLGHIDDYKSFLNELDKVWEECKRVLVKGSRMVVIVGDVFLSRKHFGRHKVVPLHADIQVRCEKLGFDNLAPIFWHKISNAKYEAKGNTKFLGKPYEPNGIIKHDIEYLLMLRKPGGYRKPSKEQRKLSIISESEFNEWFNQIWHMNGTSTRNHPAPYPEGLANRLIRMYSFVGDTVLDPFSGSGTTTLVASKIGRNSIGVELNESYAQKSFNRIKTAINMFNNSNLLIKNLNNGSTST